MAVNGSENANVAAMRWEMPCNAKCLVNVNGMGMLCLCYAMMLCECLGKAVSKGRLRHFLTLPPIS